MTRLFLFILTVTCATIGTAQASDGCLRSFVAGAADMEEPFTLLQQGEHLFVQPTRRQHGAIDAQQFLCVEVRWTDRMYIKVAVQQEASTERDTNELMTQPTREPPRELPHSALNPQTSDWNPTGVKQQNSNSSTRKNANLRSKAPREEHQQEDHRDPLPPSKRPSRTV